MTSREQQVAGGESRANMGGTDEKPPVLGEWRNLYALVIAVLVAIIALLLWLTRTYS